MDIKDDAWYIDSGCSNHIIGDKSIFSKLDSSFKSQVKLGNGALVEVEGKGTISINTKKGAEFVKDVLLVPNLKQILLSPCQMMEKGYSLHFEGNFYCIYDNQGYKIAIVKT